MFEQLFNSPFLYSLSLTLVHFLWQGLLVALILKSLLFLIDTNKSKLRYALATFAMLANVLLAVLTFIMVYPDTSSGINSHISLIPLADLVNELTQQNSLLPYPELLPSILAYSIPYISLLWLATITMLASKLLIEIRNVNNLPAHSTRPPSSTLLARFEELAKQIGLTKTPKFLISLKAEVPMAIGWLKPVVLLPVSMVTGLDSAQLEMLILHELAHIRRHDYLVNFLQTLIELLFFFHPSVHWIGKQIRNEREYCSDDIAVQHCGDAIAYAHTLTDTASLCAQGHHFHTIPTMAMAATGGDLKVRVLRLVDHHCAPTNSASKWLAAISILLALTLLSINQVLTLPFAQQINNQFPWQESNSISKDIFKSTITSIDFDKASVDSYGRHLTNDSIALQLLSSEQAMMQAPLVEGTTNQHAIDQVTEQVLIAPTLKALTHESSPVDVMAATQKDLNSNLVLTKGSHSQSTLAEAKETPSNLAAQLAMESHAIAAIFLKKIDVSAVEKSLIKPINKALSPVVTKPQPSAPAVQTAKTEQFPPATAKSAKLISTKLSPVELIPTKLSLAESSFTDNNIKLSAAFDNKLSVKGSPNRQASDRQESNELATINELHPALYTAKTGGSQTLKASVQQVLSPESIKVPRTFKAKLLESISPEYPSLAKRRGIEMEVKVDFTIGRDGKVTDINFTQQSKLMYFKSAIRSAIRKWRFSPAIINNRKVKSKMSKIFAFSLHA